MKSTLMKELLDLGDAFEEQYPDQVGHTLANFLAWATNELPATTKQETPLAIPKRYDDDLPALSAFVAQYLTKASRYFRFYVKKALDTTPLLTFDDFISLVYCAERGSMTKTDLVEATVNEKTSGMLVIKRLIDRGLVQQMDNEEDRRSRCITLTDEGRAVLRAVQPTINQSSTLLTGDLSEEEQTQLALLLQRLDRFHEPLFLNHRESSLTELAGLATKT